MTKAESIKRIMAILETKSDDYLRGFSDASSALAPIKPVKKSSKRTKAKP
jgi:hypothetical protein